ncbi:DNA gyrase/topoisomerase IV subunit A [Membranicola marinus]|uniref:DNA gyrase/topoisomerase IV subunit A n=1 Tax=Membranihabitans marinus TaxID=1227546 RepID=A0A953HMC0_9BACT|nr:DNA gyrase/topoisomerase IV subunit A [Membranihabitans marinus]MBY5957724.1 DNA gyrase/topoisomerase IV subunit A [Membranihabitans marinus]
MAEEKSNGSTVIGLDGMYENYFLDYASYVILERAIPTIEDGLKPVQRRILHAMFQMNDGRFHKVANIIGQTMQYHPHGDAAIGDALVKLGQKDLLIDQQGNWGNIATGDAASAPRYIEARLSHFALEVAFNKHITDWQLSYDGRNKEPIQLPMKFPLLLAQGAEGIAVGLSTRIMPHNFNELIDASIKILQDKSFTIYPDFQTGGYLDITDYNHGERGGRIKVRARIEKQDKNTLVIKEIPYGTTTSSLIDSILKANDKGKINIKKITDNTAKEVEVVIDLASGQSPELTIEALYAFTYCEVSISPNACVIVDDKPMFLDVREILRRSTMHTKALMRAELKIQEKEWLDKYHFASLEKIFIENRVYHEIEEAETWEAVLEIIDAEMRKYIAEPDEEILPGDDRLVLARPFIQDDILRLTEIKIKKISKYNKFKAEEAIQALQDEIDKTRHHLAHLTEYCIDYFTHLKDKYGKDRQRRTKITTFGEIEIQQVVANNAKLYVNYEEGFIGSGLKKATFIRDCSDIDDVIAFRKDGHFQVSKIDDKVFMGKDILHADIWYRGDERTTYHMVYLDGKSKRTYIKRFQVKALTRDREYDLTKGTKGSRVLYFSVHPNGESEVIKVTLSSNTRARKKVFEFDFGDLDIKGRRANGNILTKYAVRKIEHKETGGSTLEALKVYMDNATGQLNMEERGRFVGEFEGADQLIVIHKDGSYELLDFDPNLRLPVESVHTVARFEPEIIWNVVYYEGSKKWTMVKRFQIETSTTSQRFPFLTEHRSTKLLLITPESKTKVMYRDGEKNEEEFVFEEFIDVKGWKALGNKLDESKVKIIEVEVPDIAEDDEGAEASKDKEGEDKDEFSPGDTVDLQVKKGGQGDLFD